MRAYVASKEAQIGNAFASAGAHLGSPADIEVFDLQGMRGPDVDALVGQLRGHPPRHCIVVADRSGRRAIHAARALGGRYVIPRPAAADWEPLAKRMVRAWTPT